MKLIIDIPEEYYKNLLKNCRFSSEEIPIVSLAIAVGTPLEKHDEEVIKETVASIWGKPPHTEVLDKIRAEIENKISSDTDNIVLTQKFNEGLITSIAIIDKYRKGKE